MKYYEVKFTLSPFSSDASDLLAALAGEAGFETFEETADGLQGYVQQQLFSQSQLDAVLQEFPLPDVAITYSVGEAEDRDWNEQWEQQGFEPIIIESDKGEVISDKCRTIIIHDGRHLPDLSLIAHHSSLNTHHLTLIAHHSSLITHHSSLITSIEIDAQMAFGTGTHETTRMVCATLLDTDLTGKRVLDCGCGTGILGIAAMKLGARECVGYDIDEWSVDNTRHNAVINHVELTPLLGDASILSQTAGEFDVVMANINRNILIQDLPAFCHKMAPGALLILSGFYAEDIPLLTARAAELGMRMTATREDHDWASMVLKRE